MFEESIPELSGRAWARGRFALISVISPTLLWAVRREWTIVFSMDVNHTEIMCAQYWISNMPEYVRIIHFVNMIANDKSTIVIYVTTTDVSQILCFFTHFALSLVETCLPIVPPRQPHPPLKMRFALIGRALRLLGSVDYFVAIPLGDEEFLATNLKFPVVFVLLQNTPGKATKFTFYPILLLHEVV